MPTKYELQAELRELNRGFPRMAITKMKMHELEAAIDSVKKLRTGALEALATKTPSKTGRPSSRPISVENKEDEDVVIRVPQPPAERKTKPPPKVIEEELNTVSLFPGVMRRAEEKRKVDFHSCTCSDCPKKNQLKV